MIDVDLRAKGFFGDLQVLPLWFWILAGILVFLFVFFCFKLNARDKKEALDPEILQLFGFSGIAVLAFLTIFPSIVIPNEVAKARAADVSEKISQSYSVNLSPEQVKDLLVVDQKNSGTNSFNDSADSVEALSDDMKTTNQYKLRVIGTEHVQLLVHHEDNDDNLFTPVELVSK